jgi:hypothetical protein
MAISLISAGVVAVCVALVISLIIGVIKVIELIDGLKTRRRQERYYL